MDRATGRQCEKLFQEKRMHSAEEYHCFEGPRILYASRSESPLAVCMDCGLSDDTWILKKKMISATNASLYLQSVDNWQLKGEN